MIKDITIKDLESGVLPQDDYMNIVMFFGATCGPCKMTMPHYEEMAKEIISLGAKIRCYRLHAWENEETSKRLAETMGVQGVPHFKVFLNGQVITDKVGGGDLAEMSKFFMQNIDDAWKKFGVKI